MSTPIHTRLHIIDQTNNDIVFYPENTSSDVILDSTTHNGETLSSFIDSIGDMAFKDNVDSNSIIVSDTENPNVPEEVNTLNDLVKNLGQNAFSSGTTATSAIGDQDGLSIKENYLKKVDAFNTYVSKEESNTWTKNGEVQSSPSTEKIFLLGSTAKDLSTEIAKKNTNIYVSGSTLVAPKIEGIASSAVTSENANNAKNDGNGNPITTTYVKNSELYKELEKYVPISSTESWKVTDDNVSSEASSTKFYMTGSTASDSSNGKLVKNVNIYAQGSTLTAPYINGISEKAIRDKEGNDIALTYFKNDGGTIRTNPVVTNDTSESGSDNTLITKKYLKDAIQDLVLGDITDFVDAMVFKGTVGDDTADYLTLPTSDVKRGFTFKVIGNPIEIDSSHSSTSKVVTAKVGDLVTALDDTPLWTIIPSGDEPSTYIRFSKDTSNLTESFATGNIILGEASTKQISTVVDDSDKLVTSTAVKKTLQNYATKEDLDSVSKTDNKVESYPTTTRLYLVGSPKSELVTDKLGKNTDIYSENGKFYAPEVVSNLTGKASSAGYSETSKKAEQDGNGNIITDTYINHDALNSELDKYVSKSSTISWAVTDRNVASIVGTNKMYLTGSLNETTNTGTLQKTTNIFVENGVLNAPSFKGNLTGTASSAINSENATKATQDGNGNVISDFYLAKKDTVSWDVSKNDDTHVTNTVSDTKIYLTGSPSSISATETQNKNTKIYAQGSTLTAPLFSGNVSVPNLSNENIKSKILSEILNSLGAMAFRNSSGSLDPTIVHVFDGGSPADLVNTK